MSTAPLLGTRRGSSGAGLSPRPAVGARYPLGEMLGQGGMSVVYRALDRARDAPVAVKVLHPGGQGASLGSEFRYIASLDHPGVVKVYDFGLTSDGRPYFTMELLTGGNLLELADSADVKSAMEAVRAVFETLAFVHARGIVHGDLKPSNILLGSVAGRPYPKLLDFGIAWDRDEASAHQGGTAHFMAPELILRGERDHRCDLYAMGVVLYLVLTGGYPFESERPRDVFAMHLGAPVPDPRDAVADLDGELCELCVRLLEKRAEDRCGSAREAIAAIDGWLERQRSTLPPDHHPAIAAPKIGIAGGSRFIGFDAELRQLLQRAVATPSDGGALFLVSGEAGAGKTRLLQELRIKLQLASIEVVSVDLHGCRGVREPLERIAASVAGTAGSPMLLQQLGGPRLPGLPNPLPEQLMVEAEKLAKAAELLHLARPTVLLLEGLDAAPDEAAAALSVFLEAATRGSIMAVATHRGSFRGAAELAALDRCAAIDLRRLSARDAAQVVRSLLGEMDGADAINEHVYRESGGNPGAIERVVRALCANGAVAVRGGRWVIAEELGGKLPVMSAEASIRAIAAATVAAIGPEERAVAQAAAHIDERFELSLLRTVYDGAVDEPVKKLAAAQVIEPEEERWTRYRFSQRAVRELLVECMTPERRLELSRAIASELERQKATGKPHLPEVLARHLMLSGRYADAAEIAAQQLAPMAGAGAFEAPVLRAVLARPSADSPIAAHRWCELQMELCDFDRRRGAATEAIAGYRAILARSDGPDLAQSALPELAQSAGQSAVHVRCSALRKLGDLLMSQGAPEGEALLREALETARLLEVPQLLARACYSLADHLVLAGRHDEGAQRLTEALSHAREDRELTARILCLRARSRWMSGCFSDAEADARAAASEYQATGSTQGMAVALGSLGNALYSQGRLSEARSAYLETLGHAKTAGWLTAIGKAELNIATIDFYSDDWDGACEHWQAAIAIAERTGNRIDQVNATHNIACVAAMRGEHGAAARLFERALNLAKSAKYPTGQARVLVDLAQMCLDRRHLDAACEHAARGIEVARAASVVDSEIGGARTLLELQLLDGRNCERVVDEARGLLARAEAAAVVKEIPHIRRVLGEALARSGQRKEAQRILIMAEQGFEKFGSRYEAARVTRVMAELAGEQLMSRAKLGTRLREIGKLFRRLRAQPELDRVRAARSRLGDVKDTSDQEIAVRRVGVSTVPPKAPEPPPSASGYPSAQSWAGEDEPQPHSLGALIRELTGILELDRLLERLVDGALATTNAERGLMIACDRAGNPRLRVSRGSGGVDLDGEDLELSKSAVQQVMRTRERVVWHRSVAPPAAKLRESVVRLGLCAVVGVPMLAGSELIGVMYLDSRAASFEWGAERLDQLDRLAEQAAMALVNARKFDEQREKTELITAAARDLRDPLEAALGYVDRLRALVGPADSPAGEQLQALSEQTQRLAALVSRVFEVASGDPAELGWSMVSIQLKELIESALVPVRALAVVGEIELSAAVPRGLPTIFGNRQRLIQVVETLAGEAVRGSSRGERVTLTVAAADPPPTMAIAQLDALLLDALDYELSRDQVVRIEVEHAPRPDARGDEVGLAIARKVVARHGGLMWSEPQGARSRSLVTFPVLVHKASAAQA